LYRASSLSEADEAIVIVDLRRLGKKFPPSGRGFSDCLSGGLPPQVLYRRLWFAPIGRWLAERVAAPKLGGT
jgi:hypothetical protein